MAETAFTDLMLLAKRGFWSRDATLALLSEGAWVADRLPATPLEVEPADVEAWEPDLFDLWEQAGGAAGSGGGAAGGAAGAGAGTAGGAAAAATVAATGGTAATTAAATAGAGVGGADEGGGEGGGEGAAAGGAAAPPPVPTQTGLLVAGAAGPRIYIRMRHRDAAKLRELRDQIELQRDRESDRPETGGAGPP